MEKYVWLFPILFIFHDMEEIIGFGIWIKKNRTMLDERYPKISKIYDNYSTEGMALAVFEELVICILFCILALALKNTVFWLIWFGGFVAYTFHLIIHVGQSLVIRKYIPALITSIIALPISIWVINRCVQELNCGIGTLILFSLLGILIVGLNLKFAQSLISKFTNWMARA